jgi:hypothetical protein
MANVGIASLEIKSVGSNEWRGLRTLKYGSEKEKEDVRKELEKQRQRWEGNYFLDRQLRVGV